MDFPLLATFLDFKIKYFGPEPGYLRFTNYQGGEGIGCSEIESIVNGVEQGPVKVRERAVADIVLSKDSRKPALPEGVSGIKMPDSNHKSRSNRMRRP